MFYVFILDVTRGGCESARESERQHQLPLADTTRKEKKTGLSGCGSLVVVAGEPVWPSGKALDW